MRYALTITDDPNAYDWGSTDTLIVAVEAGFGTAEPFDAWYRDKETVAKVITAYGWSEEKAKEIAENNWYFVRNVEDVDININAYGEVE